MPLYEYECTACHRRTEKIQKFSDAELTICPHCGGPLERTLTAPNVQFKGGGWYKDLYSSTKPAASGSGETSGAATGASDAAGTASAATTSGDGAKSGETAKSTGAAATAATAPSAASAPATKP